MVKIYRLCSSILGDTLIHQEVDSETKLDKSCTRSTGELGLSRANSFAIHAENPVEFTCSCGN